MAMTDPLGDMLTRIRNGQQAKKDIVLSPASKLRANVLEVLQREGYIRGYSEDSQRQAPGAADRTEIFRGRACDQARRPRLQAGPPGLFGFEGTAECPQRPRHHHRLDAAGRALGYEARTQNVGGEVLAEVF